MILEEEKDERVEAIRANEIEGGENISPRMPRVAKQLEFDLQRQDRH